MVVSIVIPVYNASKYISLSIESILNQTHQEIELLICNDASTDDSSKIIRKYSDPRVTFFENSENKGYLRTINFLVSKCTGEFIAFQDADDLSHPERLERQVNFFRRNANVHLLGTNYTIIDDQGNVVFKKNVEEDPAELKTKLYKNNPFQKPSIMFRRQLYEEIGMYREEFLQLGNISEDYDWILRVAENHLVANINHVESLYLYRSLSNAMSKGFTKIDQLFGHDVVKFLANERQSRGSDSIDEGKLSVIFEYIKTLRQPYCKDGSLFYHDKASSLLYVGLRKEAIKISIKAIFNEPFKFKNYRLLQYCLRKSIFR